MAIGGGRGSVGLALGMATAAAVALPFGVAQTGRATADVKRGALIRALP